MTPIADVMRRACEAVTGRHDLPDPLPPDLSRSMRTAVTLGETAALAGTAGEHFDAVLAAAREAFRLKAAEMSLTQAAQESL
ncbi:hypothetical protein EOD42_14430 [Rhodovarius crocodyli]|uniref:Uncharacterized protein n=1 Tax=Rhodovarius crocodyli TaxID=1979269 RepID=A0A437MF65_9PROT|nr:hypothetical protein [Rhodovarius crocodyli]RVT96304.1 hypothetical protein EOD42_14430 [Rhodovarius crocodyli]